MPTMETIPLIGISEPISSLTHLFGVVFFLILSVPLLKKTWGNHTRFVGLLFYSISLLFLFSMSGIYHLVDRSYPAKHVFRILDYAAIWILIASSFLPIHIVLLRGIWRWGMLGFIWAITIAGMVLTTVYFDSTPTTAKLSFFLCLGWFGIFSGFKIIKVYGRKTAAYLLLGGVAYTVGAFIDQLKWPVIANGYFGPHEIFHIFVLIGAFFHWKFIYQMADHPLHNVIVFIVHERPNNHYIAKSLGDNIHAEAYSKKELHQIILQKVSKKFHPNMRPSEIICRYLKEEVIEI